MKKLTIITMRILCLTNINFVYAANDKSTAGNGTASCDSTCMTNAVQASQTSNLQQRVIACVSGFTGTRLQTRVKNQDGSWSDWTDKNIDNCTCAPTSKTQTSVCEEPLKGTKTDRSTWTCTGPKSGVWSNWTPESNNCYTPCQPLPDQTQTVSCSSGYKGTMTQTRSSSCVSESGSPTWSSWTTTSNNCIQDEPAPVYEPEYCTAYASESYQTGTALDGAGNTVPCWSDNLYCVATNYRNNTHSHISNLQWCGKK